MLKTTERIIAIADLRDELSTVVQNAQKEPLVITVEGRPAAYLVGVEMFDALLERLIELEREELIVNVAEGERQFSAGEYLTLKEAIDTAEKAWQGQ